MTHTASDANPFSLSGKVAVVIGGYGVLGGGLADGLAAQGARTAVLGRRVDAVDDKVATIRAAGGEALPLVADALDEHALRAARDSLVERWGPPDILINAAGGNVARARNDTTSIFDVPLDAFEEALRLNLHGTVIPTFVFGEAMARHGSGSIVNISSMAALQALSGVLALFGRQSRNRQLYALDGRGDGAKARRRNPGQRHRARAFFSPRRIARCSSTRRANRRRAPRRSSSARRWAGSDVRTN